MGESVPEQSQYAQSLALPGKNEERPTAFFQSLPNGEKEARLFSQLIHAQGQIACSSEMERFIEGFRLQAKLMLDPFLLPGPSQ